MLPDVNEAARSVEPVSIVTVGEPEEVFTPTVPSNATRISIATPDFFEPFAVFVETPETVGATVSIDADPVTEDETFSAASVCTAVRVQVPSTNVPRSHVEPVVEPATVHTTSVWNARVAVTVMVPPFSEATTRIVGVLSLVRPSLELEPVSLDESTAIETGAVGEVVSTTTEAVDATETRLCPSTAYAL